MNKLTCFWCKRKFIGPYRFDDIRQGPYCYSCYVELEPADGDDNDVSHIEHDRWKKNENDHI